MDYTSINNRVEQWRLRAVAVRRRSGATCGAAWRYSWLWSGRDLSPPM